MKKVVTQARTCQGKQLELFERRLPSRPYCTDDLECGLRIRDPQTAARVRYIQANPPWIRSWLLFDVDREGAAMAWDDANLPEPAWTAMNPVNAHAHLSYGLDAPVLLGEHDRQQPMRYLAAVESAMRAALEADPGYSGLITKNPKHSAWRVLWGHRLYDLAELSEWLDLPKHTPRRRPERAGVGRNVDTFDWLRYLAYRSKRWWLREHGRDSFVHWQAWLYRQALDYTHAEHPDPLDHRETHWIAKSVAKWVWRHFDPDASDQRFSALQSARGKRGGRPAMKDQQAQARLLRARGLSQRAIANELGVNQSSVARWLR